MFENTRAEKHMKVHLVKSWKSGTWDQYLSEIIKWKTLHFQLNELKQLNYILFAVKGNLNNLFKLLLSIKGSPPTPPHSESHPCTSPPSGGHEWSGRGATRLQGISCVPNPSILFLILHPGVFV